MYALSITPRGAPYLRDLSHVVAWPDHHCSTRVNNRRGALVMSGGGVVGCGRR